MQNADFAHVVFIGHAKVQNAPEAQERLRDVDLGHLGSLLGRLGE